MEIPPHHKQADIDGQAVGQLAPGDQTKRELDIPIEKESLKAAVEIPDHG